MVEAMSGWIRVVVGAALVAAAGPAWGQADEFRAQVDKGMKAYKSRRYDVAVRAFERAFELKREPELVYNVARAYEKSLQTDNAIQAYERFLGLQGTTAELRAKALEAVEALKSEKRARARAARRAEEPVPVVSSKRRTSIPPTSDPTQIVENEPSPSPSRALEWTLIGTGVAVAAVGGVFAVLAALDNANFNDLESTPGTPRSELEDLQSTIDRNALIADVLVPTGLVAAAAGIILILIEPDEAPVAVSPMVGQDLGGIALGGRF